MRNIYITFLLSLLIQVSYSQKKIIIIDSISKIPLEYVSIINLTKKIGFYSDTNGMSSREILKDDIYKFSFIGYKDKIIKGTEIELSPIIELMPNINSLKEVNIKNNIYENKILTFRTINSRNLIKVKSSVKNEICTKIHCFDSITRFKILSITVPFNKFYKDFPIRLHFYNSTINSVPGESIINENILLGDLSFKKKGIYYEFDLSKYNVIAEASNIFIGFEFIHNNEIINNVSIILLSSLPKSSHYSESYTRTIEYPNWIPFEYGKISSKIVINKIFN